MNLIKFAHTTYFTPKQEALYKACTKLFLEGVKPTPKKLREVLHGGVTQPGEPGYTRSKGIPLNGRECYARRQWFRDFGYHYDSNTGRWNRTAKSDEIETELKMFAKSRHLC